MGSSGTALRFVDASKCRPRGACPRWSNMVDYRRRGGGLEPFSNKHPLPWLALSLLLPERKFAYRTPRESEDYINFLVQTCNTLDSGGDMKDLVKPIAGILTSKTDKLEEVIEGLSKFFGKQDIVGPWQPFTHSDYYEDEMGPGLSRCFVSFADLGPPYEARDYKKYGSEVEDLFKEDGRRSINIDPGYIDANKVVLISGKHGGHKIEIAPEIWADMLLWYNKGWQACPWAFPDFRDGSLFPTFMNMRRVYKETLKNAYNSANCH